jgi:hypothetical protein
MFKEPGQECLEGGSLDVEGTAAFGVFCLGVGLARDREEWKGPCAGGKGERED